MQLEKDIPADLDIPGVPDLLRAHLSRRLRGACKRIKIEAETEPKAYTTINAIKLADRGAVNNAPGLDEAALLVTQVLYAHYVESAGNPEHSGNYRVTVEMRNDKGKTPISEKSFVIRYVPGDPGNDNERELLQENTILSEAIGLNRENMALIQSMNTELFERIMEMSRMMVAPIQASSDMQANATMMWTQGANLLVEGHKNMFNIESVTAIEKAKSDRIATILEKFGGPLAGMSMGLIEAVMKKFGINSAMAKATAAAASAASPRPDAEESAAEQGSSGNDQETHAEEAPIDNDKIFSYMVEGFAMSLSQKQRKSMRENLSKDQMDALENLFCADTNDDVLRLWPLASAALADKIGWLAQTLTPEQMGDFMKIRGIVEKNIAKQQEIKKEEKKSRSKKD